MAMKNSTASIPAEDVRALEAAGSELMRCIRTAVREFRENPPAGSGAWEEYRTPDPWETRALPNLELYQRDLRQAVSALGSGELRPMVRISSCYTSLSKDMEFDFSWMAPARRIAVRKAIDTVVEVADRIHRAGYKALAET